MSSHCLSSRVKHNKLPKARGASGKPPHFSTISRPISAKFGFPWLSMPSA
ncbi:hypothetical protein Syun_029002 [Stephania yunnanensis]|uniref:Uncharacterized protein n=1 Tax=Stephania yunnanensis TaxID=152371 RepID=A0AAP0HFM8_9MAGN